MKRFMLVALGLVTTILGLFALLTGASTFAVFGRDGSVVADTGTYKTSGSALAFSQFTLRSGLPVPNQAVQLAVRAQSPDKSALFVGYAPRDAALGYLSGAPFGVVTSTGAGNEGVVTVPGTTTPEIPASKSFWTEKSESGSPEVAWTDESRQALVVMTPDASPGVEAQVDLVVSSKWAFPIALAGIIGGALLGLAGISLIVRGVRAKSRAEARAAKQAEKQAKKQAKKDQELAAATPEPLHPPIPASEDPFAPAETVGEPASTRQETIVLSSEADTLVVSEPPSRPSAGGDGPSTGV